MKSKFTTSVLQIDQIEPILNVLFKINTTKIISVVNAICFQCRYKKMIASKAASEGIRNIGSARAEVAKAVGEAEAEGLLARAEAFSKFTEAAKLRLVLDMLPALAAEVCAPLARTTEIVMVGEGSGDASRSTPMSTINGLGKDFMRMSATVPPTIRAITGVDLSKVCFKIKS